MTDMMSALMGGMQGGEGADPSQFMAQNVNENRADSLSDKERQELLSKLNKMFDTCRKARTQFERQWYMNMAFYFGRQYVTWAPGASGTMTRLYEPAAPKWRVRLVVNKIRPSVRFELTKITKEQPQIYVIPASTEDSDVAAARAGEQIAEYEMSEMKFNRLIRRSVFWALLCGSSFLKTYYDEEQMDPSGVPGKICVEPVNAFHILAPLMQEEEIENQPFLIHAMTKDKAWINWRFGKEIPADSSVGSGVLEQQFLSALGVNAQNQATSDQVYVKEAWIKPCKDFENGALVSWAGDQILTFFEQWPYDVTDFPFAKIDHLPTGRFYGESTITDLIPLQRELNRTRSQIVEAKNKMAKPQLLAVKGSVDVNKITSEPGLVILYTPGFNPPTPIPLSNLPEYIAEELNRLQQDIDEQTASYEITKGRTPPGVEAASAIAYLQEENDTKFAHTSASLEEATEKVGQQILGYVAQYWDVSRKINVLGENSVYEAKEYSKANINGNTNLRVESGSAAPRSRAAKQAFITELGKMGWITPDKALRYMDMVETGRLYEESQLDARQVQRENHQMTESAQQFMMQQQMDPMTGQPQVDPMTGQPMGPQPLPINEWDDDQAHVLYHTDYMKTQDFENLDPQIQQVHVQHLQLHRQRQQSQMAILNQAPPNSPDQGAPGEQPQQSQQPQPTQ